MGISVFISTVSDEFRSYRDQLKDDLERHNVNVKTQEFFKDLGEATLDKLDEYIRHCDAVVHLVGDMTGSAPGARELAALLQKHPDLPTDLPPVGDALAAKSPIAYTQWEAWLGLYHKKLLLIAEAAVSAPRDEKHAPDEASRAAQTAHLRRLQAIRRYPGCKFANADELAKHIAYTGILDLLVKDYASKEAQAKEVAEGFIREMAGKVAADRALDFEGMKKAVQNAIDIYEKEIAGGIVETNVDAIVDVALQKAKTQVDKGQSGLARATLRRAAEEMRRDEQERRERYEQGVRLLYQRERDIALAAYDGEAAAQAAIELAGALHGDHHARLWQELKTEEDALYVFGRDRGSNVHLTAAIVLDRRLAALAQTADEKGYAHNSLGIALQTLGERESGRARLEEAVAAYRAALEDRTRERVPLDWAMTQNNLGLALWRLGERDSGTARLEDAVAAYRAALEEWTRERVPLEWATTQNNLGLALWRLGARESGTARLEEAVEAYRAALEERTRVRVPLNWATTQNNLGAALQALAERESGTAGLEEAVAAYRAALEEFTRERVPLDWATTQNNLGNALRTLGERESGTARLEQAVAAYRAALEERTRERVPLDWAMTRNNLGIALVRLGEQESGTARLEEAVAAYRAALEEWTRERVPLDWAKTQNNLGNALSTLGERESGTARLEAAVAAYCAALEERTRERVPIDWAGSLGNQGATVRVLAERKSDGALARQALAQIETAVETLEAGGHARAADYYRAEIPAARALVEKLGGGG